MEDLTNNLIIQNLEKKINVLEDILVEFPTESDWKKAKQTKLDPNLEVKWLERQPYVNLTLNQIFNEKQSLRVEKQLLQQKELQLQQKELQLQEKELLLLRVKTEQAIKGQVESDNVEETDFCIKFSQINVAASSLKDSDSLALLWRPIYISNYRFLGNRSLNKLYDYYESHFNDIDNTKCLDELMSGMKFPPSFKTITSSETSFNMNNLKTFLKFICSRLTPEGSFTPLTQTETSFRCYFASPKSKTEEVIISNRSDIIIPHVATETKGIDANGFKALPQVVHCGSDILLHKVKRLGFPTDLALVPFIMITGECIQIGSVYSLAGESDDFYPVPILLTRPLNFLNANDDLMEMVIWLKAIADHCNYQIDEVTSSNSLQSPSQRTRLDDKLVKLSCSTFFLKPIQLFRSDEPELTLYSRNIKLLKIFERLWNHSKSKKFVVFPIGFLGYPNKDNKEECEQIDKIINKELWRAYGHICHHVGPVCAGHPIVVYPNIEKDGWIRSVDKNGKILIPKSMTEIFFNLVTEACRSFEESKVCHLDMRLPNIFFKENLATKQFLIKIVDWDYSQFFGYHLESQFIELCSNSAIFPRDLKYADEKWHNFMLNSLRDNLF